MNRTFSVYDDDQVSEDKSGKLGRFSRILTYSSMKELSDIILKHHGVAGRFLNNYRNGNSLIESYCLFFDFDSGKDNWMDVASRLNLIANKDFGTSSLSFVIAASKSHMMDKEDGKGVIQRFHLYIELDYPISEVDYYKFIWEYFEERLGWTLDRSCKTPTKYSFKHREILLRSDGPPLPSDCLESSFRLRQHRALASSGNRRVETGEFNVDLFIKSHRSLIEGLSSEGQRHNSLCTVIGKIKKMGFGMYEIREVVFGNCTLERDEIKKTIKSFF